MSTVVIGFRPPDEKWEKMKAVWYSCEGAGIDPPKEVSDFFDDMEPDPQGVEVALEETPCVREWHDDTRSGFELDVSKLPKDVTVIRFYNSW